MKYLVASGTYFIIDITYNNRINQKCQPQVILNENLLNQWLYTFMLNVDTYSRFSVSKNICVDDVHF